MQCLPRQQRWRPGRGSKAAGQLGKVTLALVTGVLGVRGDSGEHLTHHLCVCISQQSVARYCLASGRQEPARNISLLFVKSSRVFPCSADTACSPEQHFVMARQRIATLLLLHLAAAAGASAAVRVSRADASATSGSALQHLNRRQRGSGDSASDDAAWAAALRAASQKNSANCFYALSGWHVLATASSGPLAACVRAGLAHGKDEDDTSLLLTGCKQATTCIRVSQAVATLLPMQSAVKSSRYRCI